MPEALQTRPAISNPRKLPALSQRRTPETRQPSDVHAFANSLLGGGSATWVHLSIPELKFELAPSKQGLVCARCPHRTLQARGSLRTLARLKIQARKGPKHTLTYLKNRTAPCKTNPIPRFHGLFYASSASFRANSQVDSAPRSATGSAWFHLKSNSGNGIWIAIRHC